MNATPATYEEILAFILAQLSEPVDQQETTDGALVITSGDPEEVVIRLSKEDVVVAEFAGTWITPYELQVAPIHIASMTWVAVSESAAMRLLGASISAAREARLSKFRTCTTCETSTPPEWMHGEEVCQGCAEREDGVVH